MLKNQALHNIMAEELYFIKTNPVIAKINLYNKICDKENIVLGFLDENKIASLEIIKKKVKENIETLSKEELLHLIEWFQSEYKANDEEIKNQLFVHGIDLFYEIPDAINIKSFQQILADYEKYSQTKSKHIFDVEHFNHFLIYGIFYTGLVNNQGQENFTFDLLKSNHKDLYSFAENEVNEKKSDFILPSSIYTDFSNLYDSTKFYKGSIIELHDF
jgi:hypothetical protein